MMTTKPESSDTKKQVYLETFGCQMNELDSELVVTQLRALGYRFTQQSDQADVVLYNTCSVREAAEQKVWSRLGLMRERKRQRPEMVLGVLGCMAERDGKSMLGKFPFIDVLCGPGELDKLPMLIDNAIKTGAPAMALQGSNSRRSATLAAAEDTLELLDLSRSFDPDTRPGGPARSAYVRITRGCNKFCTYCVVPFTRGAEMHRPPDAIVEECRRLVEESGVVEITLLGQTVNHYRFEHDAALEAGGVVQPQKGRSFAGGHARDLLADDRRVTTFAGLLRRIHEEVTDLKRLRFVTSYPRDFGDDVLETMRDCPRICRYLHVPVQSGSNRILAAMNRGYTVEEYRDFIERIRRFLPDAMIASDIIVGFPGETEEDFARTADLIRWAQFKNCFIFKYSPRPGTPAFDRLPDDVPEEVKKRRNHELLSIQGEISRSIHCRQIGKTVKVFVEGLSIHESRRSRAGEGRVSSRVGEPAAAPAVVSTGTVGLTVNGRAPGAGAAAASIGPQDGVAGADRGEIAVPDEVVQLSGRTEGDLIAVFDAPGHDAQSLIGSIVEVAIHDALPLTLKGLMVGG